MVSEREDGLLALAATAIQMPEDAAEEAEDAARVPNAGREPTQEQAQVVAVGGMHGGR